MCLVTCEIWDYMLLSNKGQVIDIALLGTYPREIKTGLHKSLYTNVQRSFIYNSLKLWGEGKQCPSIGECLIPFPLNLYIEAATKNQQCA